MQKYQQKAATPKKQKLPKNKTHTIGVFERRGFPRRFCFVRPSDPLLIA